jgi:hypothetical protein
VNEVGFAEGNKLFATLPDEKSIRLLTVEDLVLLSHWLINVMFVPVKARKEMYVGVHPGLVKANTAFDVAAVVDVAELPA